MWHHMFYHWGSESYIQNWVVYLLPQSHLRNHERITDVSFWIILVLDFVLILRWHWHWHWLLPYLLSPELAVFIWRGYAYHCFPLRNYSHIIPFFMAVAYSWYTSDKKPLLSLYCYRIICLTRNRINRRTYALIDLLFIIPVLGCIRHAIRFLSTSCVLLKLYCSFLFPRWREYLWYHFGCKWYVYLLR